MSLGNVDILKLEYVSIEIKKVEINNILKEPLQKGDAFELEHSVKALHYYNLEDDLIKVSIDATIIVIKDGVEVNAGARFEIDNFFRYSNLKNYAREENGKVLVETEFAEALKGFAYSTTRGVVACKLSETFLDGIVLPIIMSTDV